MLPKKALPSSFAGLEGLVEVCEGVSVYDNPALSVLDDVDDGGAGPTVDPAYPPPTVRVRMLF